MANISRDSYVETSLYDKVIQQQGMPITDYDLNELQDIQRVKLRRIVSELLGDGAVSTGWQVQAQGPATMTVNIVAGSYYVNGYRVVNNSTQTLTVAAAPGTGTRTDSIYLHFKEVEINSTQDTAIKHPSLTLEPTRRTKIQADVNYLNGSTTIPANTATDFYILLATILVTTGNTTVTSGMITDSRTVKAVFSSGAQTFAGTITAPGLTVTGSETLQGNITYQPTGIWSTSQTNSLIHNPLYNSANANTVVSQIDLIRTSTTDGSYDGEISLKVRATGGALTEGARIKKDGTMTVLGAITAPSFTSTVATGTAPFTVASTTRVTNLNADLLDGFTSDPGATANTIGLRDASGDFTSRRFISTVATGTAPLSIASTTLVTNFNADMVDGYHLNQGVQTTDSPTHVRLTLSQATGTSPFAITSTTVNANLNADMTDGFHLNQGVQTTDSPTFTGLTISSGGAFNTTPAGVATSGTNYASGIFKFQRSSWNGTSAVTGVSSLQVLSTGDLVYNNESSVVRFRVTQTGQVSTTNVTLDDSAGNMTARTFVSNVATGAAPLSITSTTMVTNLNANLLGGYPSSTTAQPNTIPVYNASGQLAGTVVGNASTSTKWAAPITLSATGDATGSVSFDGSANASMALTLATQAGVTAGTYTKFVVNTKGLITSTSALLAADIPALDWTKITTGKPTTISGYGITDNLVGSITAGTNITITNPTGLGAANVGLTGIVAIANGGTGSATQNFVDLTTAQTIAGAKTFSSAITLPGDPTLALQAGTKQYIDAQVAIAKNYAP